MCLDEPLTVADARERHADADKTIRVWVAERFQDQTVDEAADEAGPTDAEGHRHHRGPGEAGPLDEEPACLTQIVQHGLDLPPRAAWERLDLGARLPNPPVNLTLLRAETDGGAPDVPDRVRGQSHGPEPSEVIRLGPLAGDKVLGPPGRKPGGSAWAATGSPAGSPRQSCRARLAEPRLGLGVFEQALQPVHFVAQDAPAVLGEAIEPAWPVIVLFGRVHFGDEPGVSEALDGLVQGSRTEPDDPFGVTFDLLLNAVAVAVTVGERDQDVQVDERGRGRRCHVGLRYIGTR